MICLCSRALARYVKLSNVAVLRGSIAIFGVVFVNGHTFETKFVFLKDVLPFGEGKFSDNSTLIQRVSLCSVKETKFVSCLGGL